MAALSQRCQAREAGSPRYESLTGLRRGPVWLRSGEELLRAKARRSSPARLVVGGGRPQSAIARIKACAQAGLVGSI